MSKIIDAFFGKEQEPVAAIPLEHAVLCMNCETVFAVEHRTCPVCASEIWLNIGIALGNEATKSRVTQLSEYRRAM
jgi:hypothetical protein